MSERAVSGTAAATDLGTASIQPPARAWSRVALPLAVGIVVLVHFRPWQGGLLEEWGLSLAWEAQGFQGYLSSLSFTLGRPLHLLPYYAGMALSDGGTVGPYAVLALVAVLQLLGAWWALRPAIRSGPLRLVLALAIALHPWWPAGDVLRFLPAQVGVLAAVVWLGLALRACATGRRVAYAGVFAVPVAGLLAYQAPSGALGLGAVALALTAGGVSLRNRLTMVATTVAAVLTVLVWSLLVAPRLAPAAYEGQLAASGVDAGASVRAIGRTLLRSAPSVVVIGFSVAALVVGLYLAGRLTTGQTSALLALVAFSPLAGLIYAAQPAHLHDPERVALPIGLTLWVGAVLTARHVPRNARWTVLAAALVGAVIVAGSLAGYSRWTGYAVAQKDLIEGVADARSGLDETERLVVVDSTGTYGDVYTFLPPYLNMAVDVELGPGPDVELCTPAATPRDQPVAARFPLPTTPTCEEMLAGLQPQFAGTVTTEAGPVELVVVGASPAP